ncbi:dTDP-4-dehydrorhamnose 3,5-epimerase [Saccharibacter floricola]|uniref:dTDP-4-dehydrorhamnose 3,5-epimerase n=1 Tax=Saccharibacter floricola DSM 15669 TaxID=1123227 RepID=A0ABQ0NWL2_9PROT|nr:dTDP-4-dehydrorhamnose 3,5-epimerase [Saccharibacter floricola]GBQ05153.1 dTDP-4-dehydrorhamnose 3,5-epimerase [Saccharibacter floricola DSM 15669]
MDVTPLSLPDVLLITPRRFEDNRGFFSETYNQNTLKEIGITVPFVQDNQSLSRQKGVVRGLHCQLEPYAQGKLIRATRGAIWDVAVDARTGSPTYGKWAGAELSAENWSQLWVPPGFLHGFVTLEENTEVQYKCTSFYNKDSERSVKWDCAEIGIEWPISADEAVLSEKDLASPSFSAAQGWFSYKG